MPAASGCSRGRACRSPMSTVRGWSSTSTARSVMHTAPPSVVAVKLRERTPAGKLVTLHFPRRMCSRWFVEALVSVRVRMRTEQAVSRPGPNRGRRDAKSLGHLFLRQESLVAQSVIATLERIVILDEINDHLPCKRSPVAGAMPVLVEDRRNAAGCVRFQQRVDLGPDGGARLRQLPRAQGDGQGERSRAPAAEAHMGRDRVL